MMMIEDIEAMDRVQAGTWAAWDFGMDRVVRMDATPENDGWYTK
jgi:hypothetical protein